MILLILGFIAVVSAGPAADNKDSYKDQYSGRGGQVEHEHFGAQNCTDPRTMRKHAAYTEWADAYSCTRHRCQPGGRNLAIYTVGCKRVEAPESAIECEEVVEDTNMQFPFCCTRLRCLVVVRGEVWTRVLGQPWEVLPAAPWSHMYKMKKPPPTDTTFLPKTNEQGPVYELSEPESDGGGHEKVLRAGKKQVTDSPDCNEVVPRAAAPPPDIVPRLSLLQYSAEHKRRPKREDIDVDESDEQDDSEIGLRSIYLSKKIALSTNNEVNEHSKKSDGGSRRSQIKPENSRHKRGRKTTPSSSQYFEEERERDRDVEKERERNRHTEPEIQELDDLPLSTEKPQEASEEHFISNTYGITLKPLKNAHHQVAWTEIPSNQWNEHEGMDVENRVGVQKLQLEAQTNDKPQPQEPSFHQPEFQAQEQPEPKAAASVITSLKEEKPSNLQALVDAIGTRMRDIENVVQRMSEKVHQAKPLAIPATEGSGEKRPSAEQDGTAHKHHKSEAKHPTTEAEHYKRFTVRNNRGSKYLHSTTDTTTDQPLYIEDTNSNGYFSDASNSVLRRANPPKEPPPTYMAPVENRRKTPAHIAVVSDTSDDAEKKRKKHSHKKRKNKSGHHKKHHAKDDKRKHFNRLSSVEMDKNVVSLEDSSALANK